MSPQNKNAGVGLSSSSRRQAEPDTERDGLS
jgi:hypothetical protein